MPEREVRCARCKYEHTMAFHVGSKHRAAKRLLAELGPQAYLDDPRILLALDDCRQENEREDTCVRARGMMARLERMPDYLMEMPEPIRHATEQLKRRDLRRVKVYGVGGSAAPAQVAGEVLSNSGCHELDFEVVRCDDPPFGGIGPDTLLLFSSFSGNTEEIINCFKEATRPGATRAAKMVMSTGGELAKMAEQQGVPWLKIPHRVFQPRESALLQIVAVLGVVSDAIDPEMLRSDETFRPTDCTLKKLRTTLCELSAGLNWRVQFWNNEAKQIAARLCWGDLWDMSDRRRDVVERSPLMLRILSGGATAAVAFELYTQVSEASKMPCHRETLPEALHNLVEWMRFDYVSPRDPDWSLYVIESEKDDERRVADRWRHTSRELFPGLRYRTLQMRGATPLERSMSGVFFNAWLRLYMAFLNGVEPLPVPSMDYMKKYMSVIPRRKGGARDAPDEGCGTAGQ
jgi:glucose/mannose-6-phosphate isomerase